MRSIAARVAIMSVGVTAVIVFLASFGASVQMHVDEVQPPPPDEPEVYPAPILTDLSDYIWPTDGGFKTTSSFGEFRRMHFHGGVDIGTGSTTGFRVYAMRDGFVARISVSPVGYGKMLYVRHADGYYTTYAHLERFNVEIDARVQRMQRLLERYPVTIECTPDEFPVRKGDIIAYTGETGVGSPHLHFEIRDPNLDPINPMLALHHHVKDDIPPVIYRLSLTPLDEHTLINGDWKTRIYQAKAVAKGRFNIGEPIQVSGRVGFAIQARDRSNASWFRHGVYGHDLYIGDSLICSTRLDRVPGPMSHQIGLYYDWNLLHRGRGRFERLYANSPSTLQIYNPRGPSSGIVDSEGFPDGRHRYRIVTHDFHGNISEVSGSIVFNHPPRFDLEEGEDQLRLHFENFDNVTRIHLYTRKLGMQSWSHHSLVPKIVGDDGAVTIPLTPARYDVVKVVAENPWKTLSLPRFHFIRKPEAPPARVRLEQEFDDEFVRVVLSTDGVFTSAPTVYVYEGDSRRVITMHNWDINTCAGTFRPLETYSGTRRIVAQAEVNGKEALAHSEVDIHPIVPGTSGTVVIGGGALELAYEPLSVFKTLFLRVEKRADNGEETYMLHPGHTVLNGGLTVRARVDPSLRNPVLLHGGGSSEELLATTVDEHTGTMAGRLTRTIGDLFVASDVTPPSISRLHITRPASRTPVITFSFSDDLAGVDYHELKVYINGRFIIPEIDGEDRRVVCTVAEPLEAGTHNLTIIARDRVGNTRTVEQEFSIR